MNDYDLKEPHQDVLCSMDSLTQAPVERMEQGTVMGVGVPAKGLLCGI